MKYLLLATVSLLVFSCNKGEQLPLNNVSHKEDAIYISDCTIIGYADPDTTTAFHKFMIEYIRSIK